MTDSGGLLDAVASAYSRTSSAWAVGPDRVYGRLAAELVGRCPGGVTGRRGLDIGAGTGAATRAMLDAGASGVVAIDVAAGMLAHDATHRPPAVVGDASRLPIGDASIDVVVAAFSLNHLVEPAIGLREAARTLVGGGALVASAYADDDTHPVKGAVDGACRDRGWVPPDWYEAFRTEAAPRLATVAAAQAEADRAGLDGAAVDVAVVPFPDLPPRDLVAWRLGMAQVSDFVGSLSAEGRVDLAADAIDRLGSCPPLVRRFVVVSWMRPPIE